MPSYYNDSSSGYAGGNNRSQSSMQQKNRYNPNAKTPEEEQRDNAAWQEAKTQRAEKGAGPQHEKNIGIAAGLDQADDTYYSTTQSHVKDYKSGRDGQYNWITGKIDDLSNQAQNQATDARETYTNDIRPNQKNLMEQQMGYANDAMSLQEAGDPNNSIQTAIRGMYDERASGARKQGMADFGVMSAMGAQAAAGQMGNVPMTAGSMQNIYAVNQGQAGEAVSRAQNKVDALQQQGIDRGFDESDRQYGRGERERDRAAGRISDFQTGEERYQDSQGRFRGEIGGYDADTYGLGMGRVADDHRLNQGLTDLSRDVKYGKAARDTGISDQYFGQIRQDEMGRDQREMAREAGETQRRGQIYGALGTAAGAYFGGGMGAAAAGAGQYMGQQQTPPRQQYQSYQGGYGGGGGYGPGMGQGQQSRYGGYV